LIEGVFLLAHGPPLGSMRCMGMSSSMSALRTGASPAKKNTK
jgi:hypothetical protein